MILKHLISHFFDLVFMLQSYYLIGFTPTVTYEEQPPHPLYRSEKKKSCISPWSSRLYPTAVNQTQVGELPPSHVCLSANLFALSFFSFLSVSLFCLPSQTPSFYYCSSGYHEKKKKEGKDSGHVRISMQSYISESTKHFSSLRTSYKN